MDEIAYNEIVKFIKENRDVIQERINKKQLEEIKEDEGIELPADFEEKFLKKKLGYVSDSNEENNDFENVE